MCFYKTKKNERKKQQTKVYLKSIRFIFFCFWCYAVHGTSLFAKAQRTKEAHATVRKTTLGWWEKGREMWPETVFLAFAPPV